MSLNNENSTIRLLIYILTFLVLILLILLFFIIPNIKSYKISQVELKNIEKKIDDLKQKEDSLKSDLKKINSENRFIIDKFDRDFNKSKFVKFANRYLQDIKITEIKDKNSSKFREYKFSAYSKNSSPKEFFKFIESLKDYESVVKVNFPILLEKQNQKIFIKLVLDIYRSIKN